MDQKALIRDSASVVQGRVLSTSSYWNRTGQVIVTDALIQVEDTLLGKAPTVVIVRTFGGTVDGYTIEAHGFPTFRANERLLLFLEPETEGAARVTGYQQGQYRIVRDKAGDGSPMLNLRDPLGACGNGCLAATFTGYYTTRPNGTRRIYDADMVTNPANNLASLGEACSGSEYYAEGIMVHEAGHLLGLGHSGTGGATMFPSVSACNNGPASIEAGDRNGTNDLY